MTSDERAMPLISGSTASEQAAPLETAKALCRGLIHLPCVLVEAT